MAARTALVAAHPRGGFWNCFDRVRLEGPRGNPKRVWRVYCQLRLNLPRRMKKRLPRRLGPPLTVVPAPNAGWAVDFLSDTLSGGRRFRTLNVWEEGVRDGLTIEVDTALPAERVIRVLEQVVSWRGRPQALRLDNGPERVAEHFLSWCAEHRIGLRYIQPGKPAQNGFLERFTRTYRTDVLNASGFESLDQVREISAEWLQSDNEARPHGALAGLPPATYRAPLPAKRSPLEVSR